MEGPHRGRSPEVGLRVKKKPKEKPKLERAAPKKESQLETFKKWLEKKNARKK